MRIQANPMALASIGLNLDDMRTAIAAANVNQAKGNLDGKSQSYTIGANDQLLTSAEYRPLIVAYNKAGARVHVRCRMWRMLWMARKTWSRRRG